MAGMAGAGCPEALACHCMASEGSFSGRSGPFVELAALYSVHKGKGATTAPLGAQLGVPYLTQFSASELRRGFPRFAWVFLDHANI